MVTIYDGSEWTTTQTDIGGGGMFPVEYLPEATQTEYSKHLFYLHGGKIKYLNKEVDGSNTFEQLPDLTYPIKTKAGNARANLMCSIGKYIYYPGKTENSTQGSLCRYDMETNEEELLLESIVDSSTGIDSIINKDDNNLILCAYRTGVSSSIYNYNIATNTATLLTTWTTDLYKAFSGGLVWLKDGILYSFISYYNDFPAYLLKYNISTNTVTYDSISKHFSYSYILNTDNKIYFINRTGKTIYIYDKETNSFENDITFTSDIDGGYPVLFKDSIYYFTDTNVFIFDFSINDFRQTDFQVNFEYSASSNIRASVYGDKIFFIYNDYSSSAKYNKAYKFSLSYSYVYKTLGVEQ